MQLLAMCELESALRLSCLSRTSTQSSGVAKLLEDGQFEALLQHEDIQAVLPNPSQTKDRDQWAEELKEALHRGMEEGDLVQLGHYQALGVACLQLFSRVNWTGQKLSQSPGVLIPLFSDCSRKRAEDALAVDGDSLVSAVMHPELLMLARMILVEGSKYLQQSRVSGWWALRCCLVHVRVLEEKSDLLHETFAGIVERVEKQGWDWSDTPELQAVFLLEAARCHNHYHEVKEAGRLVEEAAKLVGLEVTETGALGKRTRFQQKDLAQFTLDVVSDDRRSVVDKDENGEGFPKDLRLEDEVRLEKIAFTESGRGDAVTLSGVQQAVVMGRFEVRLRALPIDSLTGEEVLPYLTAVLGCRRSWAFHCQALLARSKLESRDRRSVERALMQVQTVVDNLAEVSTSPRLHLLYCSGLPPTWEVEKQLGSLYMSMGSTKSALELYLRLEMWDEVIICYNQLELRHKAAEIIQQQLDKAETPRLWCLMGDATDDVDCYHKALELSGNKNARAYRCLGLHHYYKKDYSACIPHLEQSLERSSYQLDVLLRLGYAGMQVEDWTVAARAYRKYCAIEQDNFETWNNLGNCYIKMGQKERAWRVLLEAVKCDYDNWKVWDNLMVLSTDLGIFDEVIRDYHRLVDIKQTHIDVQVLEILVTAVMTNVLDRDGQDSSRHTPAVLKLLGRVTSIQPKEAGPWRLYGNLLGAGESAEEKQRAAQCLQRATAVATGVRGWEKDADKCTFVLRCCRELMEAVGRLEGAQALTAATSGRLTVNSVEKAARAGQTSVVTGEVLDGEVKELLEGVKEGLAALVQRIALLKAE